MFAHRSSRAVAARLAIAALAALVAGAALAQSYSDVGGTKIPAFVLLDGCIANGACAGPNSAANPLYVAPATGVSMGVTAAAGAFADGWNATQGAKTDPRSAATDATAISAMQALKEISYLLQNALANDPALVATSAPSLTPGALAPLSVNANGALRVLLEAPGGADIDVTQAQPTYPYASTSWTVNDVSCTSAGTVVALSDSAGAAKQRSFVNVSGTTIYIGPTSPVTTSNGFAIPSGAPSANPAPGYTGAVYCYAATTIIARRVATAMRPSDEPPLDETNL